MPEPFDTAELLALVEDDRAPDQTRALLERSAPSSDQLRLVQAMRDDRQLLRAVAQPRVPAEVEQDLERLLMQPTRIDLVARQWRRQHRRRNLAGLAYALAAGVIIAAGAGIWVWLDSGIAEPSEDQLARRTAEHDAPPHRPGGRLMDPARPAESAIAEHLAAADPSDRQSPSGLDGRGGLEADLTADGLLAAVRGARPEHDHMVASMVALVIHGPEPDAAVVALRQAVEEHTGVSALVRNLSYGEIKELERTRLVRSGQARDGRAGRAASEQPRDKVSEPSPLQELIDRAARRSSTAKPAGSPRQPSGLVAGRPDAGAPFEQQLFYADHGADLTVTVSASQLESICARLREAHGLAIELRRLNVGRGWTKAGDPSPQDALGEPVAPSRLAALAAAGFGAAKPGIRGDQGPWILLPVLIEAAELAATP